MSDAHLAAQLRIYYIETLLWWGNGGNAYGVTIGEGPDGSEYVLSYNNKRIVKINLIAAMGQHFIIN